MLNKFKSKSLNPLFFTKIAANLVLFIALTIVVYNLIFAPIVSAAFDFSLSNGGDKAVAAGSAVTNPITATASGTPSATTYVQDSFTGTSGTVLSLHNPDAGNAWSYQVGDAKLLNGKVQGATWSWTVNASNTTMPSADYDVSMDIISNKASDGGMVLMGVSGRTIANYERYIAYYDMSAGLWKLNQRHLNSESTIGSFAQSYVVGEIHNVRLSMVGTAIKVYIDGVQRISVTDSSVTAVGSPGIVTNSLWDPTLLLGDNFLVTGTGGAPAVTFSSTGLPTGVTSSFQPTSCSPNCTSSVTISAQGITTPGIYPITVTATGGVVSHTTNFNLTVNPAPSPTPSPTPGPSSTPAPTAVPGVTIPVLYPSNQTQSPINNEMVQRWKAIAATGVGLRPSVFMKVGDSNSLDFMRCFEGDENGVGPVTFEKPWLIQLDGRDYLKPTIQYFRSVPANGTTSPYLRDSIATVVGSGAIAPLQGSNPTLIQEFNATMPQYAIIMFGSNDIGNGWPSYLNTYESGLRSIVDELISRGVIPVLTTMPERNDNPAYKFRVQAYNGVVRAIAQGRQIPMIDLNRELLSAPNYGLTSDNVHLASLGSFEACQFRASLHELDYGLNMRYLISMESLHRLKSVMTDNNPAPDVSPTTLSGNGTSVTPYLASSLPFVDMRDSRTSTTSAFTNYSCAGSSAAPGPEYLYRLDLSQTTGMRAVVLDKQANAVNVNLLSAPNANSCLKSDSRIIETTLNPGTYYVAVDSLTAGSGAEYTLSLTPCLVGDPACGGGAPSPTPSPTPTPTPSSTPAPSPTPTASPTPSSTPSPTPTPTPSGFNFALSNGGNKTVAAGSNVTNSITATLTGTTSTTYVQDSFTGTNGVALSLHNPDVGSAWSYQVGDGRLLNNRVQGATWSWTVNVINATMPSANYEVSMDIISNGPNAGGMVLMGVSGRTIANYERYVAFYDMSAGLWKLNKRHLNSESTIGSFAQPYVIGQTHNVRLSMVGTAIKVYIDGTLRISVTDSSVTAAGSPGIVTNSLWDPTQLLGDNFLATSIPSAAPAVTFSTSGLPTGASFSFLPTSCIPTCTTTMTLNTLGTTTAGSYPVTVTGTAGALSRTTNFNLIIN